MRSVDKCTYTNNFITDLDNCVMTVAFRKKKCPSKPAVRVAAALVGIALAIVAIMAAYTAGKFESNPELPEIMEGEATFTSDDGKQEVFHVMIDYKRKLVQLTSLEDQTFSSPLFGRRLMSFEVNNTANGTGINATKIVIQDFNSVSSDPMEFFFFGVSVNRYVLICLPSYRAEVIEYFNEGYFTRTFTPA